MANGTVTWFNAEKGFGHFTFEIGTGTKGPQAEGVRVA